MSSTPDRVCHLLPPRARSTFCLLLPKSQIFSDKLLRIGEDCSRVKVLHPATAMLGTCKHTASPAAARKAIVWKYGCGPHLKRRSTRQLSLSPSDVTSKRYCVYSAPSASVAVSVPTTCTWGGYVSQLSKYPERADCLPP